MAKSVQNQFEESLKKLAGIVKQLNEKFRTLEPEITLAKNVNSLLIKTLALNGLGTLNMRAQQSVTQVNTARCCGRDGKDRDGEN